MGNSASEQAAMSVFSDIEAEHARWRGLMDSLPTETAGLRVDDKWSAVEALAHVTSWIGNAVAIALAQARPDAPELELTVGPARVLGIDVESFNRAICEQWSSAEPRDVLAWADRTHDQLMSALQQLPPERLLDGSGDHGARRWYWTPAYTHSTLHRNRLEFRLTQAGDDAV